MNGLQRDSECSPAVLRVTHVSSSSVLSAAASTHRKDTARPQIFISGEIHGDERIVSNTCWWRCCRGLYSYT